MGIHGSPVSMSQFAEFVWRRAVMRDTRSQHPALQRFAFAHRSVGGGSGAGGRPILSQSVERARPRTPPADHRQTAKLPGGRSDRDAVGRPRHGSVCEQPRRSLAPTHTPTGTPDAAVQVSRPSATLRVGAWRGAESLSGGAASLEVGPPPPPSHTGVRRKGGGDVCLLKGRSGLGFAGKNRATWLS